MLTVLHCLLVMLSVMLSAEETCLDHLDESLAGILGGKMVGPQLQGNTLAFYQFDFPKEVNTAREMWTRTHMNACYEKSL